MTEGPGSRSPVRGIPPTAQELYLLAWGQETLKENLKLTNDILRQQVTLSAALIAATIALRGTAILTTTTASVTLAILVLSLLLAGLGAMPYESQVDLFQPDAILAHKERAFRYKISLLRASATLMVAALIAASAGTLAA